MLFSSTALLALSVAYVGLLFYVAHVGDVRAKQLPKQGRSPLVYSLALCTYCTSWTFYGAVGRASRSGWDFLPIYLGPALMFLLGHSLLRRIISVSKANHTTSVADFIGARYGRHQVVPAMVAVIATLGIIPYIALQLKAVSFGFDVMVTGAAPSAGGSGTALLVSVVMAVFAILFGTRELSSTENHHGMVLAVAFESLVKLLAFVAVGVFALVVTHGARMDSPMDWRTGFALGGASSNASTANFLTQTLLAGCAVLCLPRQFHIAVVENASAKEFGVARFAFPIYLLLVSLFVIPIAEAGRAHFANQPMSPDMFVLALPLSFGHSWLGLAAYIGGFSAATGMVIVETIALSTMVSNELVMPVLVRWGQLGRSSRIEVPRALKLVRRAAVVVVIALAYLYCVTFTGTGTLTEIGLLSFAAVAQFAPSLLGGVLWNGGSYIGVVAGLAAGACLWVYTLLFPALAQPLGIDPSIFELGPLGIAVLRPQHLLGSSLVDPLTHGVVWSLGVNTALYLGLSLLRKPGLRESLQVANFLSANRSPAPLTTELPSSLVTVGDLQELARRFLGDERADELLEASRSGSQAALEPQSQLSPTFARQVEHALAAVIGASSARLVLSTTLRGRNMRPEDVVRLLDETSHTILFTRELLRSALENLPQGISVVDGDLRLVAWNQRYKAIFGYPAHMVVIGRPIEDLIRFNVGRGWLVTDDIDRSIARRLGYMRAGQPFLHEREMPNGIVLEMRGNPMPAGGFVTSYSDVTLYKRAQAALEEGNATLEMRVAARTDDLVRLNVELARSKRELERAHLSKARFLAAAAHDLAQPITAARLFISSIEAAALPAASEALVRKTCDALGSAEHTLTSLLDYSRLDGGSERVRVEHFELESIVRPLFNEFVPLAREKGLGLTLANCEQVVMSDPHLLRRVLQNLVSNAVRYTSRGRVLIGCRRQQGRVAIHVIDTGPGIPASQHHEIFDEYRRLFGEAHVARVGLGLGLAITKRISAALDHPIGLRSVVGRGSDFFISVPLGERERIEKPKMPAGSQRESMLAGKSVVCVEDEPDVLSGLQAMLSSWGCNTMGFLSADQAIAEARSRHIPVDLLIVDYHLGSEHQGIDVARELRRLWAKPVPVIVVTAADLRGSHLDPDDGVIRIVRKPIRPGALRALLDVVLT